MKNKKLMVMFFLSIRTLLNPIPTRTTLAFRLTAIIGDIQKSKFLTSWRFKKLGSFRFFPTKDCEAFGAIFFFSKLLWNRWSFKSGPAHGGLASVSNIVMTKHIGHRSFFGIPALTICRYFTDKRRYCRCFSGKTPLTPLFSQVYNSFCS